MDGLALLLGCPDKNSDPAWYLAYRNIGDHFQPWDYNQAQWEWDVDFELGVWVFFVARSAQRCKRYMLFAPCSILVAWKWKLSGDHNCYFWWDGNGDHWTDWWLSLRRSGIDEGSSSLLYSWYYQILMTVSHFEMLGTSLQDGCSISYISLRLYFASILEFHLSSDQDHPLSPLGVIMKYYEILWICR